MCKIKIDRLKEKKIINTIINFNLRSWFKYYKRNRVFPDLFWFVKLCHAITLEMIKYALYCDWKTNSSSRLNWTKKIRILFKKDK